MPAKRTATTPPTDDDADRPLTDEEFARGRAAYLARHARETTGLSQTEFAERYGIPVASLRDWEQGRRQPDSATQAYLRAIARIPEAIAEALSRPAA